MNISSIYPNSLEKSSPDTPSKSSIKRNLKEQALELMRDGKTAHYVAEKLKLNKHTLHCWRSIDRQKKY